MNQRYSYKLKFGHTLRRLIATIFVSFIEPEDQRFMTSRAGASHIGGIVQPAYAYNKHIEPVRRVRTR